MKQYLSVVIVTVICILAIICAWGWRVAKSNEKENIDRLSKNIQINNIKVYEENDEIKEEVIDTNEELSNTADQNTTSNSDNISSGMLTLDEIKMHEGKNKSYNDVKSLMLKYAKNGASLSAEREGISKYLKIEYKVALDISNSSMKLVEPEKSVNEYIAEYLETARTYDVEISSEDSNIVSIIITGN